MSPFVGCCGLFLFVLLVLNETSPAFLLWWLYREAFIFPYNIVLGFSREIEPVRVECVRVCVCVCVFNILQVNMYNMYDLL